MDNHDDGARCYPRWISRTLAAGVAAMTLVGLVAGSPVTLTCHATPTGKPSMCTLVDGSLVVLGPDAQIEVHYSAKERGIELRHGEALFSVKDDPARPFIVRAGDIAVRALVDAGFVARTP